jgi:alanine racemase
MKFPVATLTVNLDAIASNYQVLKRQAGSSVCAAVVKANAYGLGAKEVTKALYHAGCRHFFVAYLGEGIELRSYLKDCEIYVFHGPQAGTEQHFLEHRLIPVLNTLQQAECWSVCVRQYSQTLPYAIHIDTGMNRLGFSVDELEKLQSFLHFSPHLVMSHLACADTKAHQMNEAQRKKFSRVVELYPDSQHSLANSSGVFLGAPYQFDLVRPGCALYGINPTPDEENPMESVVTLNSRILQLRSIDSGQEVGYGAAYQAAAPLRVATVAVGYADGYFRAVGNKGYVSVGGFIVPVIGRVSMDLLTIDVSSIPEDAIKEGDDVELIGDNITVDMVAEYAGTIGYEVLTHLGARYQRVYTGESYL